MFRPVFALHKSSSSSVSLHLNKQNRQGSGRPNSWVGFCANIDRNRLENDTTDMAWGEYMQSEIIIRARLGISVTSSAVSWAGR